MKSFTLLIYVILCSISINAQTSQNDSISTVRQVIGKQLSQTARDSILESIPELMEDICYRIRDIDRYKMYPTENLYTLIRLDTKTGRIHQVQWSLDRDKEFIMTINGDDLSWNTGCGTFELYPTQNMYQFILLDKESGRCWHVQWGIGDKKRWIRRIY